jgi:hypothetical protein
MFAYQYQAFSTITVARPSLMNCPDCTIAESHSTGVLSFMIDLGHLFDGAFAYAYISINFSVWLLILKMSNMMFTVEKQIYFKNDVVQLFLPLE